MARGAYAGESAIDVGRVHELGRLIEIFNPEHQHLAEERDSKRIEAQIPGSEGDDSRASYVDLDRGIVHIAVPPQRFGPAWQPEPRAVEDSEE